VKRVLITIAAVASVLGCDHKSGSAAEISASRGASSEAVKYNAHILVDQFGYRPSDPKFAVIRNPKVGFDAADTFSPGQTYQVRSADSGAVVYSGKIIAWKDGAVDPTSGDMAWWFDFSSVNAPGVYYIYDTTQNARSPVFAIDQHVYRDVLKAAVRMYYYQRAGIAKREPFAEKCWVDAPAYLGANQDSQAHDITDRQNPAKIRDLSGGWFDAGDTNKYVTNASTVVHQLLTTYEENPQVFTDDFNIPESGNGVPDILDEVKWETDWLKRMQYPDGSVALKVGDTVYTSASPPSSDKSPRFYVPACTSSTIAAAGMFAHASYVYAKFPQLAIEAKDLKDAAIRAWDNYQRSPTKQTKCDSGEVKVPGADLAPALQDAQAAVAAIYLFALTGDKAYDDYVRKNYVHLRPLDPTYDDRSWIRYTAEQGEALLFYAKLESADRTLKRTFMEKKLRDVLADSEFYGPSPNDPYRNSFGDYYWGSNMMRANYGNTNMQVKLYGVPLRDVSPYVSRALDTLHYLHGVNPFGKVYLTNMYRYGATNSVNEIYSTWFAPGSRWSDARTSECGPSPGYLTGGPNAHAAENGVPASESPPVAQPPQKSYKDWNGQDSSWAVTEPDDNYQSAYIELIAGFAN
jgi:endoglucanase